MLKAKKKALHKETSFRTPCFSKWYFCQIKLLCALATE